jgi:hypothetical protein
MNKRLMVVIFLWIPSFLFSQTGVIKGRVYDLRTNEPLPFTNIVIYGTNIGSTSDLDGNFSFFGVEPGFKRLVATQVGYEPFTSEDFLVTNARTTYVEIAMKPTKVELTEVEIKASPFQRKEESPLSMRSLSISEIEKNPGGNRDISRVIQALPGVASSVAFRNDLVIRGGGPSENRFYLDGMEIPTLNHFSTQGASGGPIGIINVDFLRGADLYSGAFPASRGNALSAVLEMKQIEPSKDKTNFRATVGASDLGLSLNTPLNENTGLLFSLRRSYLQFLFSAIGLPFLPVYNDYQLKLKTRIDQHNELSIISIGALDQSRLNTDIKNPDERQRYLLGYLPENDQWNYAIGVVWKHFRKKGFDTWVLSRNMLRNKAFKYFGNDENQPKIQDYTSDESENKVRFERYTLLGSLKLVWGMGAEYARYTNRTFRLSFNSGQPDTINYQSELKLFKGSAFAQASQNVLNERLLLSLGVRTDFSDYSVEVSNPLKQFSPRFSASYTLAPGWLLNFNMGRYYQLPAYTTLGYRNKQGILENKLNKITYISTNHLVGGVEYQPNEQTRVTLEGFYKTYGNYPLSLSDSVALASKGADYGVVGDEAVVSTAKGRAYGLELLFRTRNLAQFNIIASYTYVRSEFTRNDNRYIPSSWDNRHLINLVVTRKLGKKWDFGAKWRYLGGAPYTPYDLNTTSLRQAWDVRNQGYLDYSRFNALRLKAYHQLDIRIDRSWYFNRWTLIAYLDVQNLYNFKADSPDYLTNRDPDGNILIDPADPDRYIIRSIKNESGQALPTVGLIVEF